LPFTGPARAVDVAIASDCAKIINPKTENFLRALSQDWEKYLKSPTFCLA
jgi:hypothetical protein